MHPRDHRSSAKSAANDESTSPATGEPRGAATLDSPGRELFSKGESDRRFTEIRARLFGAKPGELRIGRYLVRRLLGAGAMGEVHLAVDEALDRPIALKFVHAHLASQRWAERLRLEARALARLAHPNVVHVYEVGEHEGRVFLAMEFIEGGSLSDWIRTRPSWEQVLAAYVEAARGLAAAHGAGVVHRDFKPDNVLRGKDGRIAVADFGLAAVGQGTVLALEGEGEGELVSERAAIATDSRTGELRGTPAYMPPEQIEGRGDARSDQFALCVSLYEGLWGQRPFPRRSISELLHGEVDWTPLPPPRESSVSGWIWPIVRRGLAVDPRDRFADMGEWLAAIEQGSRAQGQRARRLRTGLGLALAGLLGGSAVASWSVDQRVDECASLEGELAGTWDDARREQLAERYSSAAAQPGQAWVIDGEAPVVAGLDRFRERWLASRGALCRARAGGDPIVLDRVEACLERQRRSTEAVVDALLEGDVEGEVEALREAPRAVQGLGDPRECEHEAREGGPPAPPESVAAQVEELRSELARVEGELLMARHELAATMLDELGPRVDRLDHAPLRAELLHLRGRALLGIRPEDGFEALEQAADLGEAWRHDRVVADSWRWMAMAAATEQPDLERGRVWLRRADAAAARIGVEPLGQARLDYVRGHLDLLAERPDRALAVLEPALASFEAGDDRLYASLAASAVGIALLARGDETGALAAFERSLAHAEQAYGPRHPEVALAAYDIGQVALEAGLPELARTMLAQAVEIWAETDALALDDRGRAHLVLAQIDLGEGRFANALEQARRAEALFEQSPTLDHGPRAEAAGMLGFSHYFLAEFEAAIEADRRAVAGYTEAHGAGDVHTAYFRVALGWALLAAGHVDEARDEFEASLATIVAATGVGSPESVDARFGLVAIDLVQAKLDDAATALAEFDPTTLAGMELLELELFRGLLALRRDPDDAEGLAALHRARALAPEVPGGEATLVILLDSVRARPP